VIAACTTPVPLPRIPVGVTIIRGGRRLSPRPPVVPGTTTRPGLFLQVGDQIRVTRPAALKFSYAGNRYRILHGQFRLDCRSLALGSRPEGPRTTVVAVTALSGRVEVRSGVHARRALVLSPEMLAFATVRGSNFVLERNPAAHATTRGRWTSQSSQRGRRTRRCGSTRG
jgi:hypothetical protein